MSFYIPYSCMLDYLLVSWFSELNWLTQVRRRLGCMAGNGMKDRHTSFSDSDVLDLLIPYD